MAAGARARPVRHARRAESEITASKQEPARNAVKVYSTGTCPICVKAKAFLDKRGIGYDEVRIDLDREAMKEFAVVTNGARTVPQIVVDGTCIGGFTELTELDMDGGLDHLQP